MNIQRINTAYWSYYLLKYALKCEPHGPIQLDKTNAERLGIQGASDAQLQLISSLNIAKSISPGVLGFHPIDSYCNRPLDYENMTFVSYFKIFETEKTQRPNSKCYGIDMFGFYLYETSKLTRFTNFHPTHNTKAFFFQYSFTHCLL